MKLPCTFDLDIPSNRDFVNKAIQLYGISKDINQLALTVYCKDDNDNGFEIVQFHNNRRFVDFLSGEHHANIYR